MIGTTTNDQTTVSTLLTAALERSPDLQNAIVISTDQAGVMDIVYTRCRMQDLAAASLLLQFMAVKTLTPPSEAS